MIPSHYFTVLPHLSCHPTRHLILIPGQPLKQPRLYVNLELISNTQTLQVLRHEDHFSSMFCTYAEYPVACLDTAEAGAAEDVVYGGARVPHGLAHHPRLKAAHHSKRTIPGETLGSVTPRRHRARHVEVLALVAALLVEAVGDPGAEGEIHSLPVSRDE